MFGPRSSHLQCCWRCQHIFANHVTLKQNKLKILMPFQLDNLKLRGPSKEIFWKAVYFFKTSDNDLFGRCWKLDQSIFWCLGSIWINCVNANMDRWRHTTYLHFTNDNVPMLFKATKFLSELFDNYNLVVLKQ